MFKILFFCRVLMKKKYICNDNTDYLKQFEKSNKNLYYNSALWISDGNSLVNVGALFINDGKNLLSSNFGFNS